MSEIVKIVDFVGYHKLVKNSISNDELQQYIDKYEDYYLLKLLGTDLYNDFISDLSNGLPQNPDYLLWFNKFSEKQCCSRCEVISTGLKEMLLGFIYYHYVNDTQYKHSLTGVVENRNENSEMLSPTNVYISSLKRYNDAVSNYNAISRKITGECNICNKMNTASYL